MAPGRKTGGRTRGTPNKLSIGRVKAQFSTVATEFDALDRLREVANTFQDFIETELVKPKPSREYIIACYDRLARVLEKILPYQRPKLQAVLVAGDPTYPLRLAPDLSVLSDIELDQLEKIMLKVGTAHTQL
jgi:hypothetical protein